MQNQYPGQQGYPPPQQQWGQQQPPPGGYNAPPNQWQQQPPYGAPQYPPQQGYNQPPPGQFNQQQNWGPPPPNAYGAPPPGQYPPQQQQWGHPPSSGPPSQFGGPPPGQFSSPPQQYGAPPPQPYGQQPYAPPQNFGPPTQPSLGYGPQQVANIDVSQDIESLRKAMKGFGTDEKTLIAVLAKKDPIQINTIRTEYDQRLRRNLIKDLEKETSGYFEKGLVQIARGPLTGDCYTIYSAMKGLGTVEAALDDVLVGRSNADINAIKTEYQRLFKRTLDSDLRGDLSAGTEQMYMRIIAAQRQEDSAPVNPQAIEADVSELHRFIDKIVGKDSAAVCNLLITRNDAQLRAISQSYQQRFRTSLESQIKSKFSGHMEDALSLLIARATDRPTAEAVRLEESMAGLGTKDELLVQRVVRCHWDHGFMRAVCDAYQRKYGKSLAMRIKSETRGDYERLMVACVQ